MLKSALFQDIRASFSGYSCYAEVMAEVTYIDLKQALNQTLFNKKKFLDQQLKVCSTPEHMHFW